MFTITSRIALRQFRRFPSHPNNLASSIRYPRPQPFQSFHSNRFFRSPRRKDDKPAYEYDPHKHQSARPLFIPGLAHLRRSGIILLLAGSGILIFYMLNIEEVPMTGRRRFNCYSPESSAEQGALMYQDLMQQYRRHILPDFDPRVKQVERVLARIIPIVAKLGIAGTVDGWEIHVIDEPNTKNAFVIPGNKVFVYSGILPICKSDDGLAAVLGHEIAHNMAAHAAERMSQGILIQGALYLLMGCDVTGLFGNVLARLALNYGVAMPASRRQESEADYIGLMIMSEACYDPEAAVSLWQRMKASEEAEGSIPQFMSTHPSNESRISRIQEWLPKAQAIQVETDCSLTTAQFWDFKRVIGHEMFTDDVYG